MPSQRLSRYLSVPPSRRRICPRGCTNPEKAKAHVEKGEAYLKDEKFQEASLEFRNAIQIDEKLASAHWGLARAYEGLQRFQEAFEELRKTTQLDPDNLDSA